MVLVVISVMGGWLTMFKAKFRGMSGDIVVYRNSVTGFGGYKQMLAEIKKLPEVDAAIPLIETFGLLNLSQRGSEAVSVTGVDLEQYSGFNDFRKSLLRQYQVPMQNGEKPPEVANYKLLPDFPYSAYAPHDKRAEQRPGMIVSASLLGVRSRENGKIEVPEGVYAMWGRLEVVPMDGERLLLTNAEPAANVYWIVDLFRTKVSFFDDRAVYVPFDTLQEDLKMNERPYTEIVDGKEIDRVRPARCTKIEINLKPGVDRMALIRRINAIVQPISNEADGSAIALSPVQVVPWEKPQERFLGAVENEKSLLTVLMGMISLVAIFLIFCILYMIVVEKTRDIGIIKSIGATSQGIAAVFLGYGLAIGVVGGLAGLGAGWLFMRYINGIHGFVAWLIGKPIWDPEVYAFDKIPDQIEPITAAVVVAVAILSAVIGAVVPAIRAGRQNPIEALRYE
ncbi:MAG: FtsX-like permease family protein [Tepidisphaeraceae bacterium]